MPDTALVPLSSFNNDLSLSDFVIDLSLSDFVIDEDLGTTFDLLNTNLSEFSNDLNLSDCNNDLNLSDFSNDLDMNSWPYNIGSLGDWNDSNYTGESALDELASRVRTLENA